MRSNSCKSEISGRHLTPWQTQALTVLFIAAGLLILSGSPASSRGKANTRMVGGACRNAFFHSASACAFPRRITVCGGVSDCSSATNRLQQEPEYRERVE